LFESEEDGGGPEVEEFFVESVPVKTVCDVNPVSEYKSEKYK